MDGGLLAVAASELRPGRRRTLTPTAGWTRNPEHLTDAPGAYALLIQLDMDIALPPRFDQRLGPGRYLYLGSAKGPGGIRARCTRHLKKSKAKRWHVDWLTEHASHVSALAIPGGDECALVRRALKRAAAKAHVRGLGATDCATGCPAHALKVPKTLGREALAMLLRG